MLAESGFWLFLDIKTSDLTSCDSFPELFFQAFQHLLLCVLGKRVRVSDQGTYSAQKVV